MLVAIILSIAYYIIIKDGSFIYSGMSPTSNKTQKKMKDNVLEPNLQNIYG